ncbi:hypothetical protein GCM10027612_72120 [Microbispora bryophytorum subsp. camponoti]
MVGAVIVATLESTPRNATHWSTRSIAEATGMSQTAISRIWRASGLKPHKQETFKLSSDPQFVEKVRDVVGLYLNPPERALVLCVDEKTQVQELDRSRPVLPMMPGTPERINQAGRRGGNLGHSCADEHQPPRKSEWFMRTRVLQPRTRHYPSRCGRLPEERRPCIAVGTRKYRAACLKQGAGSQRISVAASVSEEPAGEMLGLKPVAVELEVDEPGVGTVRRTALSRNRLCRVICSVSQADREPGKPQNDGRSEGRSRSSRVALPLVVRTTSLVKRRLPQAP